LNSYKDDGFFGLATVAKPKNPSSL